MIVQHTDGSFTDTDKVPPSIDNELMLIGGQFRELLVKYKRQGVIAWQTDTESKQHVMWSLVTPDLDVEAKTPIASNEAIFSFWNMVDTAIKWISSGRLCLSVNTGGEIEGEPLCIDHDPNPNNEKKQNEEKKSN